jgi:4-coumarate--CoA ligase
MGLLPFYHVSGLSVMINLTLYRARVVTFPAFEPTHFLKSIQDYKMTVLPMVPPLVIFLTKVGAMIRQTLNG